MNIGDRRWINGDTQTVSKGKVRLLTTHSHSHSPLLKLSNPTSAHPEQKYDTTPHTMKISTILIALASLLFHTALGSKNHSCKDGELACADNRPDPSVLLMECWKGEWRRREICPVTGKWCYLKPTAHCAFPPAGASGDAAQSLPDPQASDAHQNVCIT